MGRSNSIARAVHLTLCGHRISSFPFAIRSLWIIESKVLIQPITLVAAIILIGVGYRGAPAATYTWARTPVGTYSWNSLSNWNSATGFPNAVGDVVNLNNATTGAQTVNLNQQITLGVLNLGVANNFNVFTLAGNGGSFVFNNGAANAQLNVTGPVTHAISANANLTSSLDIQSINGFVTLSGNLSGPGALSNTSGNVSLSGVNSYAGGTFINGGGEVIISNDANLGAAGGGIAFGTGGLQVFSDLTTSRNITITNRADIFPTGHTLSLSGIISGSGAVSTRGDLGGGTVVLTGANTYGGGTVVDQFSRLTVSADNNLGAAGTNITIGTGCILDIMGTFSTNRPISLSGNPSGSAVLNIGSGFTLTENGAIADGTGGTGAQLQIQGGGTMILGGVNAYRGGTLINQTNVTISTDTNLGAVAGAVSFTDATILTTATITTNRIFTLGGSLAALNVASGTSLTINGAVGGTGSLTKLGTGMLVLSGTNSFSGTQAGAALFIRDGMVSVASDAALGAANGTISLAATLQTTANFSTNRSIILGGATNSFNVATGTTLTLDGVISGFGGLNKNGNGTLIVTGGNAFTDGMTISGGAVILTAANSLPPGGNVANSATLNVNANTSAGNFTGLGTTVVASGVTLIAGNFNQAAFTNNGHTTINGTMTNNGTLNLAAGATITFNGNFSGSQGSSGSGSATFNQSLSPGANTGALASVTFGGDVAFSANNILSIKLTNGPTGAQSDEVHVSGQLALAGSLLVTSISGFVPTVGNSFDILNWGSIVGTFSTLQLPALASGLNWNTSQLYTTGVLSVGLVGDYNHNGVVDAADYVVWRKGLGTTFTQNDYHVWRSHFGQSAGSGSGVSANVAVPEPVTLVLMLFAAVGWCLQLGRNR